MTKKTTQRKTVLVVEDERPLLAIVQAKLEKEGIRVITSRSVEHVFSLTNETKGRKNISMSHIMLSLMHLEDLQSVDAIWLDHNLLGSENGLDFVAKLKKNGGRWKSLPIFVVSNTADPALVKKYAGLKVSHYYVKAEHKLEDIVSDLKKAMI